MGRSLLHSRGVLFIWLILVGHLSCVLASACDFSVFQHGKNRAVEKEAVDLARKALALYVISGDYLPLPKNISPLLLKPCGVFVTLLKGGRVRGCMGNPFPREKNIATEIVRNTILAATADKRFPPVKEGELDEIDFCISLVGPLRPVRSLSELDPRRYGLLVRSGIKHGLLLPGEALTASWQLKECMRKAGIPAGSQVEMFAFPTVTLGPLNHRKQARVLPGGSIPASNTRRCSPSPRG